MDTVHLDDGLFRTTAPNGLVVLTETAAGRPLGGRRDLGAHRQRARAPRADGHLPPARAHGVQGHRAPHRQASSRSSSRSGAAASTPSPAATTPATRPTSLDADLPLAVEILTDLVRRPLLRESDLELERNVILEEINGVEDTPDDLVFELHAADALARPPLRLLDPRHAARRSALSADDLRRAAPDAATIRGELRDRGGGQREPRPAARRCSSARAGSRARRRAGRAPPVAPAPAARGVERARGARHRADAHRLRHRHLPAARPAALRARDPDQRLRRRDVEPAVPAGPRGAGPGLRRLRLQAASTSRPGSSASTSAPSRPRPTRRSTAIRGEVRAPRPRGAAGGGAGRREAAAARGR